LFKNLLPLNHYIQGFKYNLKIHKVREKRLLDLMCLHCMTWLLMPIVGIWPIKRGGPDPIHVMLDMELVRLRVPGLRQRKWISKILSFLK